MNDEHTKMETDLRKARRRHSRVVLTLCGALAGLLPIMGWASYYRRHVATCFETPRPECDRFVALERFACDHGIPSSPLLGACTMLGRRYFTGAGVPLDMQRATEFSRRGCVATFEMERQDACIMTWSNYSGAFSEPHFVLLWSRDDEGAGYHQLWGRDLDAVVADAEALCANDFHGRALDPSRRKLLRLFCNRVPEARPSIADARGATPELVRHCDAGNRNACHLAGFALTFGIGVHRDLSRGKALLRKACDQGSNLACNEIGGKGEKPSTLLRKLEASLLPPGPKAL